MQQLLYLDDVEVEGAAVGEWLLRILPAEKAAEQGKDLRGDLSF